MRKRLDSQMRIVIMINGTRCMNEAGGRAMSMGFHGLIRCLNVMMAMAVSATVVEAQTQFKWSGAGANDFWSTAANWTNLAAPPAVYNGLIVFGNEDAGNVSMLDQDRTINALYFTNNFAMNTFAPAHTLNLNGYTLTMANGDLRVGYNATNCKVAIQNGTLALGSGASANLIVGFQSGWTAAMTGSWLTVSGTLAANQVNNFWVARQTGGNTYGTEALLDLSAATITGPLGVNRLKTDGLFCVGYSSGDCTSPTGNVGYLKLPAALTELDVGSFVLGAYRDSIGTIEVGAGSSLTSVTARGNLFLISSDSGIGQFVNWPTSGVSWTVGSPGAPAFMRMGHFQYAGPSGRYTITGRFAVANASFSGWLGTLCVGKHEGGNNGNVNWEFDTARASVAIGGVPNQVAVRTFEIGTKGTIYAAGAAPVTGLVKLPPTVTNITVGILNFGSCNNARGRLDIGSNSMLRSLVVTQAFYFGGQAAIGFDNAGTFVDYLPEGLVMQVGLPSQPAPAFIGCRHPGQYPLYSEIHPDATARLVLSNGFFSGYFSNLTIGIKEDSTKTATGVLDLRHCIVPEFRVSGDLWIGCTKGINYVGTESQNSNGKGYLYLPETQASVRSNLYVGDTASTSLGRLELMGARMTVSNAVEVGPTGLIMARVSNAWGGLDLAFSDPARVLIYDGGQIHVAFETDIWGAVGLRMQGNQKAFFQSLVDSGRLTWSVPGGRLPEIFFDGTHTVVRRVADGTVIQLR